MLKKEVEKDMRIMSKTQLVLLTYATLKTLERISKRDGWDLPSTDRGWSKLLEDIVLEMV